MRYLDRYLVVLALWMIVVTAYGRFRQELDTVNPDWSMAAAHAVVGVVFLVLAIAAGGNKEPRN